jgi:transcriptional regulator with XRE-family HTH domain
VNDLLLQLGKRIHQMRAAKKWSQEEFAHVSGFHRTYIGQIERGEKNMSFDNLARVAGALGVTISTLLDGLENGTDTNVKLPRVDAGSRGVRAAVHRALETQKLVKRLKLQHAEMSRTILALENLPGSANRRTKASRGPKKK